MPCLEWLIKPYRDCTAGAFCVPLPQSVQHSIAGESDQQDGKVDSLKSKLYERARAMKQDGQPINLLPRYVHSRQKLLVEQQQQQQQLPTTRKEDFHCQFAGCTKICKSAGGLTLHVTMLGKCRVQNNWRSIKTNPRPYFWSKVNEPSILLATISCYNWLFICVQVCQFRSLFVEERTVLLRIFTSKISFGRRRSYAKQAILRHYALANQRFLRSVCGGSKTQVTGHCIINTGTSKPLLILILSLKIVLV